MSCHEASVVSFIIALRGGHRPLVVASLALSLMRCSSFSMQTIPKTVAAPPILIWRTALLFDASGCCGCGFCLCLSLLGFFECLGCRGMRRREWVSEQPRKSDRPTQQSLDGHRWE